MATVTVPNPLVPNEIYHGDARQLFRWIKCRQIKGNPENIPLIGCSCRPYISSLEQPLMPLLQRGVLTQYSKRSFFSPTVHLALTEQENESLLTIARETGKRKDEVLRDAIHLIVSHFQQADR